MKVSAFTYVRNGLTFDYPFIESIKSVLPLVDEFVVVIGDSNDGTREAVENLNNDKIKIIDTVWDATMLSGGLVFAQQANIGLDNVCKDADWLFHIQADELVHENDLAVIKKAMEDNLNRKEVEGILFPFYNFYGSYKYYAPSRRYHQHEIRIIRNNKQFRSYKDSQGFRKFKNPAEHLTEKGEKLLVIKTKAYIYHYSFVKPPKLQLLKRIEFGNRYGGASTDINYNDESYAKAYEKIYTYRDYDYLKEFAGTHPTIMLPRVAQEDWNFEYIPSNNTMSIKEKFLKLVEDITGKQFFIYKNYKLL